MAATQEQGLDRRVIVMAALNGATCTKADHPALPMTAAEIARESAVCREAGAAMVHVHVRDREGRHVLDAGLYRDAIAAIGREAGPDLIVQITTEAVGRFEPDATMAVVRDVRPEAVSIALKEILPEGGDERAFADFNGWMRAESVWPQFVVYNAGEFARFLDLRRRGLVPFKRASMLFVLGRYAKGLEADPADLDPYLDALDDPDLMWSFCAFGTRAFVCAERVLALGGHVRIGFENNFLRADGSPAASNADLVADVVSLAAAARRPPATAASLRAMWADLLA